MKGRKYSDDYRYLTEQLRKARKEAELSQADVARFIGRPQSYVSKLEMGYLRLDLVQLKEFSCLYKKDIGYFFKDWE